MAQLIVDENSVSDFIDDRGIVNFVDDNGNFTQLNPVAPASSLGLRLHVFWLAAILLPGLATSC